MGSVLLRTVQVLIAVFLIAATTIGSLWILGLIDPAEAKTTITQVGGVLGICLVAALLMVAVFSIGAKKEP